jgi:hypothetical protein
MMKTPIRAAIGFGVGFVLAAIAFVTWNLGHGTFTPMIANVSFLAYVPVIGVVIAFFGPPFLWASYFIFIPKILFPHNSRSCTGGTRVAPFLTGIVGGI